jgi:hypothetical protein
MASENKNNNNVWWTPEKCPHYIRWCEGNICNFCIYSKDLIYKADEYVPLASLEKYKIYTWMMLCWNCIDNINGYGKEDDEDNDDGNDNSNSSDNNNNNQRLYELPVDFGGDHIPYRDPSAPFGPGPRINEQNIFF